MAALHREVIHTMSVWDVSHDDALDALSISLSLIIARRKSAESPADKAVLTLAIDGLATLQEEVRIDGLASGKLDTD